MAMKIKWADVVLGKTTTHYTVGDDKVEDIKLDPQTLAIVVFMKDKTTHTYFGCSYALCQTEVPDIVVPEIVMAS
jgi:hypothetical protein